MTEASEGESYISPHPQRLEGWDQASTSVLQTPDPENRELGRCVISARYYSAGAFRRIVLPFDYNNPSLSPIKYSEIVLHAVGPSMKKIIEVVKGTSNGVLIPLLVDEAQTREGRPLDVSIRDDVEARLTEHNAAEILDYLRQEGDESKLPKIHLLPDIDKIKELKERIEKKGQ